MLRLQLRRRLVEVYQEDIFRLQELLQRNLQIGTLLSLRIRGQCRQLVVECPPQHRAVFRIMEVKVRDIAPVTVKAVLSW